LDAITVNDFSLRKRHSPVRATIRKDYWRSRRSAVHHDTIAEDGTSEGLFSDLVGKGHDVPSVPWRFCTSRGTASKSCNHVSAPYLSGG
jgi:hypothetical protein